MTEGEVKLNKSEEILGPVEAFQGEYRFLSNYWPVQVEHEGITYPSVEQAYKAAQTLNIDARKKIAAITPNKKHLKTEIEAILTEYGRREDWNNDMRLSIMKDLLPQKFDGRDKELREKLLATGNRELIEGNDWRDVFFGICDGVGENYLGKFLMNVREQIKNK